MSITKDDIAFALELFEDIGGLSTRKMMGGLCIYHDGTIFAIIDAEGRILIKGAGDFQQTLQDRGLDRWAYTRKDGSPTSMPYWYLPDALLDDPEQACALAREALEHL